MSTAATLSANERAQVQRANVSGLQPVVFVHGLWMLAASWRRWAELFEEAGYIALAPAWPGDAATVAEAHASPAPPAGATVGRVADHLAGLVGQLERRPVVIGHSLGGLLAQLLAGRGLAVATVALAPAPFRGVLPLPLSALKAVWPVLANPANRHRAVPLTEAQFRFAFANAVAPAEAQALYREHAVPAPGGPLFQAAAANVNPWTEAQVDTLNQERGPLLIVCGEKDNTVPRALAEAAFRQQRANPGLTEFVEMPGRGHSLVIDAGWRAVADVALAFVRRFALADGVESAYLGRAARADEVDRRASVF